MPMFYQLKLKSTYWTTKMPHLRFDLEDGQPPVELHLNAADTDRFTVFMRECTAGLQDGRRIDWLEDRANLPGGLLLHKNEETGRTGLGLRPGSLRRTLRQAIDSAST